MKNETLLAIEINRLEQKYKGSLTRKQLAQEMAISLQTLDRYIEKAEDIPPYKKLKTGKVIFPISSVAVFLTDSLIQTN